MKFIYTAQDCPKCYDLKEGYDIQGIKYTERSSDRIKQPASDRDEIDIDAFVLLVQQNLVLPVEINTKEANTDD